MEAPEGGARITITSRDDRRIAGEFEFEATGLIGSATGSRGASSTVRGSFEAPLPAAIAGAAPASPGGA